MSKAVLATVAIVSLTAAASATDIPTYDPAKVAIPRMTRVDTGAIISRGDRCLTLRTFGPGPDKVGTPVWPTGTTRSGNIITLPDGTPVPLGKKIGVAGRFATVRDPTSANGCAGRPFYVQRASQLFAWTDPGELLAMSDAVIVVRVNWLLSRDPQGDGLLTTVDTTVEETISGTGYRPGQHVRLRLPSGIDANGLWQTGTHDPLYGATGGLKRQVSGQRWVVFINRTFYGEQARVRGGKPLPDHTGGSFFWRLDGDRIINESDSPMAESLPQVRAAAGRP